MRTVIFYLLLILAALTFLFPFIWMVLATFKPEVEINYLNPLPSEWTWYSYSVIFTKIPIVRSFFNSVIVSGTMTLSALIFSSMAGYALSRLHFRGRDLIFYVALFTMMVPFQLTLIPLYVLIVKLGWTDSYIGLIAPGFVSTFGILVFRQFFRDIPQDMIDAARVDGCHDFRIWWQIVLPLSKPALVTVGILTFMGSWNELLWPLIVVREQSLMTMPQLVTLFAIGGQAESQVGPQLAASTLLMIPVVVVYMIFQRHFIRSMATSGLKG